jgi:hypothetical protein
MMRWPVAFACLLALMMGIAGCSRDPIQTNLAQNTEKDEDDHSQWWCTPHGIPEEDCIMCNSKLRAAHKQKGDWCEHQFVKSQCFACNPDVKEFYAQKYRDKYPGKEPPPAKHNPKKK